MLTQQSFKCLDKTVLFETGSLLKHLVLVAYLDNHFWSQYKEYIESESGGLLCVAAPIPEALSQHFHDSQSGSQILK